MKQLLEHRAFTTKIRKVYLDNSFEGPLNLPGRVLLDVFAKNFHGSRVAGLEKIFSSSSVAHGALSRTPVHI